MFKSVSTTMKAENNFDFESNEPRPKRTAAQVIQVYLNTLNHVFVSVAAIYMTFLCYNSENSKITWHVWLCTLGVSLSTFFFYVFKRSY